MKHHTRFFGETHRFRGSTITSAAEMAELIVHVEQAGFGHISPLLRAARAGWLRLYCLSRTGSMPLRWLDPTRDRRPLVVVIGDDDAAPTGPEGFAQAGRLIRWAQFLVLHGAGGRPEHYEAAVQAARLYGRVLMIETSSVQAPSWQRAISRFRGEVHSLIVTPSNGEQHPAPGAPAGVVIQ